MIIKIKQKFKNYNSYALSNLYLISTAE